MPTPLAILAPAVEKELEAVRVLSEEELWQRIQPWFDTEVNASIRFSGDRNQRLQVFLEEQILPVLRKFGERGQHAWELLRDPDSLWNRDHMAALVLILGSAMGWQNLDMSTVVGILVLLVKMKKRSDE